MSTVFGRLGRTFLLVAAAALVTAAAAAALGRGATWHVVAGVCAILTVVFLPLGVTFTLVQYRVFGAPAALARIATSGLPAVATITDVEDTLSRVGAHPVLRLGLTVNGQTLRRRVAVPIQTVHVVRPGAQLPVRIDPDNPSVLVVDWAGVG